MKTTEIYIEQVFIGFVILLIALAPWLGEIAAAGPVPGELAKLALVGTAAIGIAFFIGIPFDRLSDTLIERMDKLHRLSMAFDRAQRPENAYDADFYPEDRLLIRCLNGAPGIVDRLDYFRSRIRLTRALAVYGPALTAMISFGLWRYAPEMQCKEPTNCAPVFQAYAAVAAAYAIWAVMASITSIGKLPRTDQKEKFRDPAVRGEWIDKAWPLTRWMVISSDDKKPPSKRVSELMLWFREWRTWLVPIVLLLFPVLYLRPFPNMAIPLAAGAGALLTILSAWSWWRITGAYRGFLSIAQRFEK
jgi:hypothetical protein